MATDLWIRFWAKVERQEDGCWLWIGSRKENGYGQIADDYDGKKHKILIAHRVSYEWANGPMPEGRQIHHTCSNKACVNPDHLTAISQKAHASGHARARINLNDLTRLIN